MAHHRKRLHVRLGRPALVITAAVAVAVATTATVLGIRAAACSGMLDLGVTAAPAIAPVVSAVASDFNDTAPSANGRCVRITVDTEDSAAVAAELPTAQLDPPALWIPDSSLWARVAVDQRGRLAPRIDIHGSLATSPLVLAAPESVAHRLGWPATAPAWRSVADGALPVVIGNPATTTEGLTAALLVESALGDESTAPSTATVGLMLRLGRSAVSDIAGEFTTDTGSVFTATEQAVTQADRAAGQTGFTAMLPKDGTFAFDYPAVRVVSATEPPHTSTAAAEFESALRTPDTATMLTEAGFRAANATIPGARAYPADQVVTTLLRTWLAVGLDARFLTVVDVSGSMAEPTPNGPTKAGIVRDATTIGIGEFPDTSEIGLWEFSGTAREIVPIGPLGQPMDGVTRRVELQRASAALPSMVHGGTALYATALAAYRAVRAGYDPGEVNAVVLMTDGANDTPTGPDLATTVSTLRSLVDPAHPLPLFTIGIGPTADMAALRALAAATNGKAFQVDTADGIVRVFLDALLLRTCPAGCGR